MDSEAAAELDAALAAEPLRSLDRRGRADVRASGKFRQIPAGTTVYLAGEPADTLFVVARGSVRLEVPGERAGASRGRPVRQSELFGHEALVPFAVRFARAVAVEPTSVLELGASVLERTFTRAGLPELFLREVTQARRAEWLRLLEQTPFAALPPEELLAVARALVEQRRVRGEELAGGTDERETSWLVAGGLFELKRALSSGGPLYAARGDFVVVGGRDGAISASALGSALALQLPRETLARLATRHPNVVSALERVGIARATKQRRTLDAARRPVTRYAADEMERLASAHSLLAIDLDRCTRCGHCASACADSHGTARLERRGDKVVVTLSGTDAVSTRALLFPNACQHCREPACLDPCPTGAIRRDSTGAVELDQDLCTGCGACAKACPYQAIRMSPRGEIPGASGSVGISADVAMKCDLCRGHDGPDCVSACPTDAIFRLDPERDVVEVRAAVGRKREAPGQGSPARPGAFRFLASAALVPPLAALERALPKAPGEGARLALGGVGALLVVVLASHAVVKRVARVRRGARRVLGRSGAVSTLSPLVGLHSVSGVAAAACVFLHAGVSGRGGVLGALSLAFWLVAASGVFGAFVYRFLPTRLARVERRSTLPEDAGEEREGLLDALHAAVSGAKPAKKEHDRQVLMPYASRRSGALGLVACGRTLAEEEAALARRIELALGQHRSDRLAGMEQLVRAAVEMRALGTRRLLRSLLLAWLPLHLLGSALVLALLAVHVAGAWP